MAKPENEREEIARIIDEGAFSGVGDLTYEGRLSRRAKALSKADAILARQTGEQDQLTRNQAECYRDLHEIATERLGYECVLTALEDLDRIKSVPAEAQARVEIDELEGVISDLESSGWARAPQCIKTLKAVATSMSKPRVEINDAMVELFVLAHYEASGRYLDRWSVRCALTAALQNPSPENKDQSQ